jgi:hypothetical protein
MKPTLKNFKESLKYQTWTDEMGNTKCAICGLRFGKHRGMSCPTANKTKFKLRKKENKDGR